MAAARKNQGKTKDTRYKCPECGRVFERPQALGAHRRQAHGVAGVSARSQSRARAATRTRSSASSGRATATRSRRDSGRPSTASTRIGSSRNRTGSGRAAIKRDDGRPSQRGIVDRDQLLRALFPNGIPASEDAIRRVGSWLDDAEQLARLR